MTWRCRVVAGVLLIAVAIGGGVGHARKKKPKSLLPPLRFQVVTPQAVVAGARTEISIVAVPTGKKAKRGAVLQRIDAAGRVQKTVGRLRRARGSAAATVPAGALIGTVTLDDTEPGLVILRVKGSKKRPGSEPVGILVTRDPTPLEALFPALVGSDPPSHRPTPIPQPLSGQLAAAAAQVLAVDDGLLSVLPNTLGGLRPLASPTYKMGSATDYPAADTQVGKVLDELAMLGMNVTALRSALGETRFHQEGPQVGGFMLDRARGVNGLTVVSDVRWNVSLPTTDATGAAVSIVPASFTNHVILETANMTSLLGDPIIDTTNKRLGSGASTAIHELVHAMVYEEGCYGSSDDDEPFVDTVEGIINLQVQIGLDKKANRPTTGSENDLACRLADLWDAEPKGRPCLGKLGFDVPTGVGIAPDQGFVLFQAEVGGPTTPASHTVTANATPTICVRARVVQPVQFDLTINPRRGATALAVSMAATATIFDDNANQTDLPPGNYTNFVEFSSPSAVQPILVTVGLSVRAAGRAVRLGAALGTQGAGSEVCLSQIQGGCVNPAHDPICAYVHLHGAAGITITGVAGGPFPDPAAMGCGYGEVISKAGCGADTLPACQ